MSTPTHKVNIILVGAGQVGRCLVQQIDAARKLHSQLRLHFQFTALVDSSGVVTGSTVGQPLEASTLKEAIQHKTSNQAFKTLKGIQTQPLKQLLTQLITTSSQQQPRVPTIVVDTSASGEEVAQVLIDALKHGAGVVLANKKPLTLSQSIFQQLYDHSGSGSRLRAESTCGAGTPMVAALRRLVNSNDTPTRMQGTFSGTLGFLTSALQEGKPYSDVVLEAKKLGYTEPDPRDDLGGVDVARKALILARFCGIKAEMSDVKIEALYSDSFSKLSIDEFLQKLPELNDEYNERNSKAKQENKVLRYVANVQGKNISVGLEALPSDSPIGLLSGTENMVEFHTPIYQPKPMVVRGSGAGAEVTAAGVLADIVELAEVLTSNLQ